MATHLRFASVHQASVPASPPVSVGRRGDLSRRLGCADTQHGLSLRELEGGLLGRHSVHTGFLQAAPDIGWHGDRAV
jgi:hypothetical protein